MDEEVEALRLEEERSIQNAVFPLLTSSLRPSARSLAMDADGRPGGEPEEPVQDLRRALNFSTRTSHEYSSILNLSQHKLCS